MTTGGDIVDSGVFRDVIGHFASGVTIITTRHDGKDFGTTASAVSSLSMDPPMLLICLNKTSETRQAVVETGTFAVNILGAHQGELAMRFATKSASKFQDGDLIHDHDGMPLIADALAHIECRTTETATGGTHTVFLAEVVSAAANEGSPLTYFRGRFGRFEDEVQEAAYRLLRQMVLDRTIPLGTELDVDKLSDELQIERPRVLYAITKLMGDGLVVHDEERGHVVRPLDVATADAALEARALLQSGVADAIAGHLDPGAASELRAAAEAAIACSQSDPVDLRGIADCSRAFHERYVGLLGNDLVLAMYRRLRIDGIWQHALRGQAQRRFIDPSYLLELVDALEAGDAERAKSVIREHAIEVRELARTAIAEAGGQL